MPELPIISGSDAVRALEKLGFAVVRQRGSHVVLRMGSRGCVVPMHRDIKRGTLGGIIRQAGVDPDSFVAALG